MFSKNTKASFVILDEFVIADNILLASIDESPVVKSFEFEMSETVYDSFMNIKCFVEAHPERFTHDDSMTKYDIYHSLKLMTECKE